MKIVLFYTKKVHFLHFVMILVLKATKPVLVYVRLLSRDGPSVWRSRGPVPRETSLNMADPLKLVIKKPKTDGRKKNGANLRGNNVHPNILLQRQAFALGKVKYKGGPRVKYLTTITEEVLNKTVIIDGVESQLTVGEAIVQARALEAMQPNDASDTALKSTAMLWDRTEGKAKSKVEMSGPDGGPIETVETSVVLAKLFS